jgi:hypothetical protein
MGKSKARDDYYRKHIEVHETFAGMLQALKDSPYRTHRRKGRDLERAIGGLKELEIKLRKETSENSK